MGQVTLPYDVQSEIQKPLVDQRASKPKPHMRIMFAQEFQLVRGEINDQQASTGRKHTHRLANGALGIYEKMQDLMHDDGVGALVAELQIVDIPLAHLRVSDPRAFQLCARVGKHRGVEIQTDTTTETRRKQLEHATRPGAQIHEQVERSFAEHAADRRFDIGLGHMGWTMASGTARLVAEIVGGRKPSHDLDGLTLAGAA